MATPKSKLEDLNITRDELKRLEDALKDKKFREMFCEYAQEISDPENRRRYEEEIAQMERERGMDVTFIRPEPGYVLKTSVNGETKAFINISKSDKIDKPSSERKQNDQGKGGLMWHIPHSFAPPREDHDKQKNRCQVYDFVIHPDTYRMAESNVRFKKLVEDTALDGIERQFQVKLDRKNIKHPKMQFKGTPSATVIRNRNASGPQEEQDASGLLKDMPYPYDDRSTFEKMKEREERLSREEENKKCGHGTSSKKSQTNEAKKDDATVPKYTIIHRSEMDMQEYRNAPDAKPSTRPRELVIKIELPLLKSAAQANLDIFENRLTLESSPPTAYKLDLTLPYPVDDSKGSAKFDKQKRTLVVTLPVVPGDLPSVPSFISDDTGVKEPEINGISNSSHREGIPGEKPLIEVLPNGTDHGVGDIGSVQQKDALGKENGVTGHPDSVSSEDSGKLFTTAVSYSLPDFSFTQDTETVSFVLKVKNVTENSIKQESPSTHEIDFVCTSRGEGGFPLHFRLFLRFPESCKVVPEHCTVDVTAENVVLLLLKERESRGLWDEFWAGLHSDSLEKHLFLTTSNLQQQLKELDESCPGMNQAPSPSSAAIAEQGPSCKLEVTDMDDQKLTIKITPPHASSRSKNRSEDDDDELSSADIEVVHSHPSTSLHSILKHSGSSEDYDSAVSSNGEDELSPRVNSPGIRRSVSFSKHIDKATFQSSDSVHTMALKSKKKRQRKLEEKKDKTSTPNRYNSAGSAGSSDNPAHGVFDPHSATEEAAVTGEVTRSPDNQSQADAAMQSGLDLRTKPKATKHVGNNSCEKDLNTNNEAQNCKAEKSSGSENLRETSEAEVSCHEDSHGDEGSIGEVHPVPGATDGSGGEGNSTGSKKGDSIADQVKSKLAENAGADHREDSDDEEEGKDGADDGTKGQGTSQSPQGPETYNEHRTECAFDFSNAVMFDLDVE